MKEEKRYFIYAFDEMYGGLHGMYDIRFEECTYTEAEEIGHEMSADVINSYSEIEENLFEGLECEEDKEEAFLNDIAFEIFELRADAPSFEELWDMNLDPDTYIEDFCITNI